MSTAAVIVNYRTPRDVIDCVAALRDDVDEIVVVDNASGDGSADAIRAGAPRATVIERASNDGFAAGVNAGFAATRADVVLILNPDAHVRPGAVGALLEHLARRPGCGIAAPRLLTADGSAQPSAYRRYPTPAIVFLELCAPLGYVLLRAPALDPYRVPPPTLRSGAPIAHATGAALAVRRAAYDAAGPLDERFFLYFEETEWQRRVHGAGWSIEWVPEAEVVHRDQGADAPSRHWLEGARRYLRDAPGWRTEAAIAAGLLSARAGLRAMAAVLPSQRSLLRRRAAAFDELWRQR